MGERGPAPKRSTQRRRRNRPERETVRADGAAEVEVPEPDESWHPAARRWFAALARSGQSYWYEPSDWAAAWLLAESMSRELSPQPMVVGDDVEMVSLPPKSGSVAAWLKGMSMLLVTEGDRRRVQIELERGSGSAEDDEVAEIESYRRRLRSGTG